MKKTVMDFIIDNKGSYRSKGVVTVLESILPELQLDVVDAILLEFGAALDQAFREAKQVNERLMDIQTTRRRRSEGSAMGAAVHSTNSSVTSEICPPVPNNNEQEKDSLPESGVKSLEMEIPIEYECVLCLRLYHEPVSLPCGHTFCRSCLRRSLVFKPQVGGGCDGSGGDSSHEPIAELGEDDKTRRDKHRLIRCPMCRAACQSTAGDCGTNLALVNIINSRFREEYAARGREAEKDAKALAEARRRAATLGESVTPAPDGSVRMPVCLLDVLLFPNQPVTLYLFEPRYITLVNRCLSDTRRFAVFADGPQATGAAGSILEISDARMVGGGQYLVLCRGVGRCISLAEFEVEAGTSGLRYARLAPFEDEDEATGDVAVGDNGEGDAGDAGGAGSPTADEILGTELRELADRTAAAVSRFITQISARQREDLVRRYGELPKVGNSSLTSYRKLSFWLPSALALGSNASGSSASGRGARQADLGTAGRAELTARDRRAAMFRSRSLKQRLAEACEVVMASDAVVGSTMRRRERGLRRLFCVSGNGGRPTSAVNSVLLVVGIVTALWAYNRYTRHEQGGD